MVSMNQRMLKEQSSSYLPFNLLRRREVVVNAINLTGSGLPCCMRDTESKSAREIGHQPGNQS
jgi:hypothetical protein